MNHRSTRRGYLVLWLLALGWSLGAQALSSDRTKPIYIQAGHVEIDDQQQTSTYSDHVDLRQGTLHLTADRLTVHRKADEVQRMEAQGHPVRFQQRPDNADYVMRGEANRILYRAQDATVELIGDAHLWQGKDEFSGAHIVYEVNRNRVRAEGGRNDGRVRAVIHPKTGQEKAR